MKQMKLLFAGAVTLGIAITTPASIIFEDFNVNEGRFGLAPTFSGSTSGYLPASTADRVTVGSPFEGLGYQQLVMSWNGTTSPTRIRFLSGGGAAAGASGQPANTAFTTSAGVDGWIGMYLRTTDPGLTAQIWLEGPENNGSIPKSIISDGAWHLYEWDLDDETGGANGWGAVAGIVAGDADVQAGSYTMDSILFRDTSGSSATIDIDFIAKSDSGSISALVPEPSSIVLGLLGGLCLLIAGRRRI